jgi:hypothetical protein
MPNPSLDHILQALQSREPIFHRPEHGTTRADFERMTAEDFWEIGASGAIYTRTYVLDELEKRHAQHHEDIWQTSDFRLQQLAPDLYLLHYTLLQHHTRLTRRTTLWRQTPEAWQIAYHQGTIVQA